MGGTMERTKNHKPLTAKQIAFIEAYMEYPLLPMKEVGENLGIKAQTIYDWKSKNFNGFNDELERRLADKWAEMKYMASRQMEELALEGDFKASKYILDYHGYSPKQKVEVEAKIDNNITINITGEEEE